MTASAVKSGGKQSACVDVHPAKQSTDFDDRDAGFARFLDLVEASGLLDVERIGNHVGAVMIELKTPLEAI